MSKTLLNVEEVPYTGTKGKMWALSSGTYAASQVQGIVASADTQMP